MSEEDDLYFSHKAHNLHLSSSLRGVTYSCGFCGYQLNLHSSNRDISAISSEYERSMKKGLISFFSIDETRFTQREELRCRPFFASKQSWGLFQRRTKLFCRKCGHHIGNACRQKASWCNSLAITNSNSLPGFGIFSEDRVYNIKLRALQPLFSEEIGLQ